MLPRSLLYSGVDGSLAHAELLLQSLDEFLVDFGYAVSADLAPLATLVVGDHDVVC